LFHKLSRELAQKACLKKTAQESSVKVVAFVRNVTKTDSKRPSIMTILIFVEKRRFESGQEVEKKKMKKKKKKMNNYL
jgi:hypothetical protein